MSADADLGTKRVCGGCGCRFYDMGRNSIVCPKCGLPIASLAGGQVMRRRGRTGKELIRDDESESTVESEARLESGRAEPVESASGVLDEVSLDEENQVVGSVVGANVDDEESEDDFDLDDDEKDADLEEQDSDEDELEEEDDDQEEFDGDDEEK